MAFSASIGDRNALKSPREESSAFASLTSPLRSVGTQLSSASSDHRGQLHRRFTTNNIPTLHTPLSPIGQQRRQAAEPQEFTMATVHKLQVLEKKKLEYEYLKEQRRRFEAEMELIDLQSRREEEEIHRLSSDIQYGKHSQPTTPPEYSDSNGFPTAFSRPNRFSMSSINAGLTTPRGSRSGALLMSPSSGGQGNGFNAKSVPGSRRNSDEEGDEFDEDEFAPLSPVFRTTNRMSMPANLDNRIRGDLSDNTLGPVDTTTYLFGNEEKRNPAASPNSNQYLQMTNTDEKFPVLVRGGDTSQTSDLEEQNGGWPSFRHRPAQHSLPTNTLRKGSVSMAEEYDVNQTTPTRNTNRHSVEFGLSSPYAESKRSSFASPPSNGTNGMPKLQQSFSSNDVPTLKSNNGTNGARSHAEQHLHNHNASLGRIPTNGMNSRHSRELSSGFKDLASGFKENDTGYRPSQPSQSGLHASAAPFGPALSAAESIGSPASQYQTATNPYYAGYGMSGMNMLAGAMNGLNMGQQAPPPVFNPAGGYPTTMGTSMGPGMGYYNPNPNPYAVYGPNGRMQDSQARVIQQRRVQTDANRFLNYDLKTMPRTEIYTLCKDQHGCRFLQKKLEERNTEYLDIIFEETSDHVIELMTDPFGNYLCQKLLEFANDEQRDKLVFNAAPQLVSIALNQHGTRALQKMIEFISTPKQISMIIDAFQNQVVELIQDLNGNHVIQKCLNHLKSEDAQFIFDAVGQNCITVGTHRHGCCVLQRCIDHASGFQKVNLVRQITANSFHLVQDPFGNYVVQYILDLNDPSFTNPMCIGFQGHVAELAKQKFSSNVIEKCIRCADMPTKRILIEELMHHDELEKLMRDQYGNYVIQTALDFAPPDLCILLIDCVRPILPAIRNTPYGRRIQSKVQEREGRLAHYAGRGNSGHGSPQGVSTTQSPEMAPAFASQLPGASAFQPAPMYNANAYGNIASPQPHRMSNPPLPSHLQNSVQNQGYQQYGMQSNGIGTFF